MGHTPFWPPQPPDEASRRIDRMTAAIAWVRQEARRFAVLGDAARAERFVQFANGGGASVEAAVATLVAVPLVLAATGAGSGAGSLSPEHPYPFSAMSSPPPAPYFGEPDHESLLMEVGSGDWPGSSRKGLADDDDVVAGLAAHGLIIGGGCGCRNLCRDVVTEPSEVLAALSEEIMVQILHAGRTYRLTITRGGFQQASSARSTVE